MFNQPSFGGPDWVPVVVDLSGTGRANVAVYNTTTGAWWIRHWSGGGVFTKKLGRPRLRAGTSVSLMAHRRD
jgi:hypothetical protein